MLYRLSYAGTRDRKMLTRLSEITTEPAGEHSQEENRMADAPRHLNSKRV